MPVPSLTQPEPRNSPRIEAWRACASGGGFQDHGGRAFTENGAAAIAIERTQAVFQQQAEAVIMQNRFRLDRGIVAGGHRAVGFPALRAAAASATAMAPPTHWLVMQALVPLKPCRIPM